MLKGCTCNCFLTAKQVKHGPISITAGHYGGALMVKAISKTRIGSRVTLQTAQIPCRLICPVKI